MHKHKHVLVKFGETPAQEAILSFNLLAKFRPSELRLLSLLICLSANLIELRSFQHNSNHLQPLNQNKNLMIMLGEYFSRKMSFEKLSDRFYDVGLLL